MKDAFFGLAERLERELGAGETLLCTLAAERSDFVRFNAAKVRQAGSVTQQFLTLKLVRTGRQAAATIALTGSEDFALARETLTTLRDVVSQLPEDRWLAVPGSRCDTDTAHRGTLPQPEEVVRAVVEAASGTDFVGFYAGGTVYRGHANSLGQRNWHEVDTFNLDWSLYLQADKAVKSGYAGLDWDGEAFAARLAAAREQLVPLARAPVTIEPGEYRVFLSPRALDEVFGLLSWNAFSARARATRRSPLLRMEHGEALSRKVTLLENTADGIAPPFGGDGFVRPPQVPLVVAGRLGDALVSPRSAKEYGRPGNAANADEQPQSLDLAAGTLPEPQVLEALDTGLYVSDLWYLNYSDRAAARITGMTRFATFHVEHGRIAGPVNVMRFDDTLYRMLGENLVDLTDTRELLLDASTYEERSLRSSRLPGALVSALRFTL